MQSPPKRQRGPKSLLPCRARFGPIFAPCPHSHERSRALRYSLPAATSTRAIITRAWSPSRKASARAGGRSIPGAVQSSEEGKAWYFPWVRFRRPAKRSRVRTDVARRSLVTAKECARGPCTSPSKQLSRTRVAGRSSARTDFSSVSFSPKIGRCLSWPQRIEMRNSA